MQLQILHEDRDIIVCIKPPGVPSQSDKTGDFDMVSNVKNYLYKENEKVPYIGLIHRLDRPVGGIMVFAKTPEAAKNLSEQIRMGQVKKSYLTIITKDLSDEVKKEKTLLTDYLVKDQRNNVSKISNKEDKNAKRAELYYKVLYSKDNLSLVEVDLITGRHHQIRIQMAHHMGGIWGDTKYNTHFQNNKGFVHIGLYAYQLHFKHPITNTNLKFKSIPNCDPFNRIEQNAYGED